MRKVVVAEASPTIRSVADSLLRQNGWDVVCTSDGLQAWEIICSETPDLVLLGFGLSGISGLELCRQITSDRKIGGIPVALMLGSKDPVSEDQFATSGARGRLQKPFSPKEFLELVNRLAGQTEKETQAGQSRTSPAVPEAQVGINVGIASSQRKGDEVYNLDWPDLEDSGVSQAKVPEKVATYDATSGEKGLIIDDDQYGLTRPDDKEGDSASHAKRGDEDYEWFVGEIQREIEAEPRPGKAASSARARHPGKSSDSASSGGDLGFDQLAPSKNIGPPSSAGKSPPKLEKALGVTTPAHGQEVRTTAKVQTWPGSQSGAAGISEQQIERIAERVAAKLASAIASQIDKKQLMEAVRSTLRSDS